MVNFLEFKHHHIGKYRIFNDIDNEAKEVNILTISQKKILIRRDISYYESDIMNMINIGFHSSNQSTKAIAFVTESLRKK